MSLYVTFRYGASPYRIEAVLVEVGSHRAVVAIPTAIVTGLGTAYNRAVDALRVGSSSGAIRNSSKSI